MGNLREVQPSHQACFAMRTGIRVCLVLMVALIGLCAAYLIGYGRGHKAAVRDQTEFGIVSYLNLYRLAEAGDTNRLQSKLRVLLFVSSHYYDRYFSNEVATSEWFLKRLAETRAIASIERTQVVSLDAILREVNEEIRTNGTHR